MAWQRLRNRGLGGFKFVRQLPVGRSFADFACRECMVIVEIDGATHSTVREVAYDTRRTAWLRAAGFIVLRFTNESIETNLGGVLETILAALQGRDTI
jgi:very-short-patch-repair endonuclease